jgi:hypothetical protein
MYSVAALHALLARCDGDAGGSAAAAGADDAAVGGGGGPRAPALPLIAAAAELPHWRCRVALALAGVLSEAARPLEGIRVLAAAAMATERSSRLLSGALRWHCGRCMLLAGNVAAAAAAFRRAEEDLRAHRACVRGRRAASLCLRARVGTRAADTGITAATWLPVVTALDAGLIYFANAQVVPRGRVYVGVCVFVCLCERFFGGG